MLGNLVDVPNLALTLSKVDNQDCLSTSREKAQRKSGELCVLRREENVTALVMRYT